MKPVRLPAAATLALPRWGILALCLLYILPGLFGREPWKGADLAGFGVMWTMAHGNLHDWLWPHVTGLPMADKGPLAFWLGALCIKLFGNLIGDDIAARIANALFFLLGSVSVWYATYLLGRRSEAQPLKLAFGGQPEAKDFGRTLADGALLIYLGCLGLLIPSHETNAEALSIALVAFSLYQSVRLLDQSGKWVACKLGISLALLVMTRGWLLPFSLFASVAIVSLYRQQRQYRLLLGIALPSLLVVLSLWLGLVSQVHPYNSNPFDAWMVWNYRQIYWPTWDNVSFFLKYGIWFAWPAWPFAAWAIYAWRNQEKALHIALPVAFLLCASVVSCLNPNPEQTILLPILPPLAILAAFGLPTMKRGAINAIDWFAVTVMTLFATVIWLYWIADQTGWPQKMVNSIHRFAPAHTAEFHPLSFMIAICVSVAWFLLVYWRISRYPSVLWRAVVLSSGGVILCWVLVITLWHPAIDSRMSYANLALELKQQIAQQTPSCIESDVDAPQRTAFAYFGGLHFANFKDKSCDLLLLQNRRNQQMQTPHSHGFPGNWELIWKGRRAYDTDELYTLYRRQQ